MRSSVLIRGAAARFGLGRYPLGLTYELTWLCNLTCTYCDRHDPMRKELKRDQIFAALAEFYDLGMRDVSLDGGEPLAHRHVDEIVDWLAQREITIAMNTNGILVRRKLETIRKLSLVKISLDGPRDRHDAARGAGSFDHALDGARLAHAEGIPVEFTCTVGRHNVDCLEHVLDIAEALPAPVVFQPAMNSLFQGSDRDGSEWLVDGATVRAALAQVETLKRRGRGVGNGWSSCDTSAASRPRHGRRAPPDRCSAPWIPRACCSRAGNSIVATARTVSSSWVSRARSATSRPRGAANAGARAWWRRTTCGAAASTR